MIRLLLVALLVTPLLAQTQNDKGWRYESACTTLTDGKAGDRCFEAPTQKLFVCVPADATCDTTGEWKLVVASSTGGTASWGGITGTLSDQADLQASLDGKAAGGHNHDTAYAPLAKGVTNGDSHDHNGGDGAQVAYSSLSGTPTLAQTMSCSGNDKLRAYDAGTGAFTCAADQVGGGGGAFREFLLCAPGNSAAGMCHTFTNLGASFVEVGNSNSRDHLDLTGFTQFRLLANVSAAAATGDILVQCDADPGFGSPVTLGSVDNPGAALQYGAWTAIPAGECTTAGGVYIRAGMANGNGTEDPAVRFLRLQLQ